MGDKGNRYSPKLKEGIALHAHRNNRTLSKSPAENEGRPHRALPGRRPPHSMYEKRLISGILGVNSSFLLFAPR